MAQYVNLQSGDPAPWFHQRTASQARFSFDTIGGRYVVLCFIGTASDDAGKRALANIEKNKNLFDDVFASHFVVSSDPRDETERQLSDQAPGRRVFFDFDYTAARAYGALPIDPADGERVELRRLWFVLDPTLRILRVVPFRTDDADARDVFDYLASLPPPTRFAGFEICAPVLFLSNVFEPAFCKALIGEFDKAGGHESGFMRDVDGKTTMITDYSFKRRQDHNLTNIDMIKHAHTRIGRSISPEIKKVHQFQVTRIERNMVARYTAEDGGHFKPHRDNTTKGTAHRRFAVSINLNDDFEGGEVSFPEYGPRSYKPPIGGAVVFSCSLLHTVSKVKRGSRYAYLPFLYNDEAAKIREANNQFLDPNVGTYRQQKENAS